MKTITIRLIFFFLVFFTFQVRGQLQRCSTKELEDQIISTDPSYLTRRDQLEINLQNYMNSQLFTNFRNTPRSDEPIIKIPVVVHLIGSDVASMVSIFKVQEQIQILNNDFRKTEGTNGFGNGVDTKIEFCLATKDPYGNFTNGIVQIQGNYPSVHNTITDNTEIKSLSHWPASSYLNIWVCNVADPLLAWGTFPSMFLGTIDEYQDGVICGVNYFGTTINDSYGSGRTLTHEIGHWLNLRHTWGDETDCTGTDWVDDTPICSDQYYSENANGCPHPNQCNVENNAIGLTATRQIENYMDYSDDLCMNTFTNGQMLRMVATLNADRQSLFSATGGCSIISTCYDGIQSGDETGIDCGGSCQPCSISTGYCETVQFKINNKNTTSGDIINVCDPNVVISPYNYDYPCTSPHWQKLTILNDTWCSDIDDRNEAAYLSHHFFDQKCYCKFYKLFLAIQECDENKVPIAPEFSHWFNIFDGNQDNDWDALNLTSFHLYDHLPGGYNLYNGKYYKIKIASVMLKGHPETWVEHTAYIRIYNDNLLFQNQSITHDQFANNITIQNSNVPSTSDIKVVAKTKIVILPNTTLKNGRYYSDNFDCNSLDQFHSPISQNNNSNSTSETGLNNTNSIANIQSNKDFDNVKIINEVAEVDKINIYPNPAINEVNIDFNLNADQIVGMDLYDVNSHFIKSLAGFNKYEKGNNSVKFSCTDIINGVYIIKINLNNIVTQKKLIILHQ